VKVLVTGSKGFIGKNLTAALDELKNIEVLKVDIENEQELFGYTKECNFIFHLAGVNRPDNLEEYITGNYNNTQKLLSYLRENRNFCPIMYASSIQAKLDNPYGKSKRASEELLMSYNRETGSNVLIYRFPNVFGKWCRPNYNSAVATFCYNIARGLPITVSDPNIELTLVYIDDLVDELICALNGKENRKGDYCEVPVHYNKTLGEIVDLIYSFRNARNDLSIPNMSDTFEKKLYSTYLSYIQENDFCYDLCMHADDRGSFTEFIRTPDRGQVSVNVIKPRVTKGNHWHHTKNEKFLVVSGQGIIRLRKIDKDEVLEYFVSGDKMQVIDIPVGYTHNIQNTGEKDMITIIWANEPFDPNKPDTYYLEV
jgi:UDP-2-acetamido-2,6-beta-L-arabino-hexul-4-ose reductase